MTCDVCRNPVDAVSVRVVEPLRWELLNAHNGLVGRMSKVDMATRAVVVCVACPPEGAAK